MDKIGSGISSACDKKEDGMGGIEEEGKKNNNDGARELLVGIQGSRVEGAVCGSTRLLDEVKGKLSFPFVAQDVNDNSIIQEDGLKEEGKSGSTGGFGLRCKPKSQNIRKIWREELSVKEDCFRFKFVDKINDDMLACELEGVITMINLMDRHLGLFYSISVEHLNGIDYKWSVQEMDEDEFDSLPGDYFNSIFHLRTKCEAKSFRIMSLISNIHVSLGKLGSFIKLKAVPSKKATPSDPIVVHVLFPEMKRYVEMKLDCNWKVGNDKPIVSECCSILLDTIDEIIRLIQIVVLKKMDVGKENEKKN